MLTRFRTWLKRFSLGIVWVLLTELAIVSLCRFRPSYSDSQVVWWFLGGFAAGGLFFMRFHCTPVYVLGHELTHWLIAKIFNRKTSKFTVRMKSGSVRVENPNIWIVLAPYILPIYMLLFLLLYAIVAQLTRLPRNAVLGCSAALGVLYAFHLVLTCISLSRNQPDMEFNGCIYSFVFILCFNVLFLFLGIAISAQAFVPAIDVFWNESVRQFNYIRHLVWWNSLAV